MDIVDKVFEGLSLSDQAEKTRKITAHQRKKEFKKRQSLRLAIVGSAGVLVFAAVIAAAAMRLPKNSVADSDIKIDFTAEKQIEPEEITIENNPEPENESAAADVTAKTETNSTTSTPSSASTSAKKSNAKSTRKSSSNTNSTTTTTIQNRIDSNAEKVDQGSTGENGCVTVSGNVLYCKDAPAESSTTNEKTNENQDNEGDVEEKDKGGAGEGESSAGDDSNSGSGSSSGSGSGGTGAN